MKNQSAHLQVNLDVTPEQLDDYLNQARTEQQSTGKITFKGGEQYRWKPNHETVKGLIKQGGFHLLNAEQGTGKSCFCLALFRELAHKRTGSFLNLDTDVSKKWKLFLVGADMDAAGWAGPLATYQLLSSAAEDSGFLTATLDADVAYASVDGESCDSLSPQDIARFRQMAVECMADGFQPMFVFDSYRHLVDAYKPIDEIKAAFAAPLRALKKALGGTGATTIVLHHTPKGKAGSVASSGAGANSLGGIPDVVLLLERESDYSNRLVIHSRKRISETDWMIEHRFSEGEWIGHGCAREWQRDRDMQQKIATLHNVKARIFDWAQNLWDERREGFTKKQVQNMLEVSAPAAHNHVAWLVANGLVYKGESMATVTGRHHVFYPYNAKTDSKLTPINPRLTPQGLTSEDRDPCHSGGREPEEGTINPINTGTRKNWVIPCHPLGTAVEFNGGNGWRVVEANLATGLHVIEKDGLRRKDLRKDDLPIHIAEDEEL